jgi:AcrR family transcriptional regulator
MGYICLVRNCTDGHQVMLQSATAERAARLRTARVQRRVREKEARRQSILDAASAVFLEWGMHASTMDQIAERAELSKGAVYLYFSSKQELCLALLVEVSRRLVDTLKQAYDPAAPPFKQLERLIDAYYGFYRRRPDYFRLLFVVEHEPYRGQVADALRVEWTALGREALELLASIIEGGIKQGAIRRCDPWTTAVSLWASVTGVIVLPVQEIRTGFVGHLSHEELVRSTLRTLWRGIQAAPPPERRSTARHRRE